MWVSRVMTLLILCLILLLQGPRSIMAQFGDEYPMESLQCYSYLTKPDMRLICPASRNKYCVKEVSSLTQDICGATQYFGDIYVNKQCVHKKCNATCTPGTYTFDFQGIQYSRTTYCCKTDLCNAAVRNSHNTVSWTFFFLTTLVILLITYANGTTFVNNNRHSEHHGNNDYVEKEFKISQQRDTNEDKILTQDRNNQYVTHNYDTNISSE